MGYYARLCVFIAGAAMLACAARAQLHEGDIVLHVADGRVRTAGATGGSGFAPARVFVSAMGAQGVPNFTTDPGFNTVPNQFPPGQATGVSLRRAARRWDGATFCPIPVERITVSRSGTSFIVTPEADLAAGAALSLAIGVSASGNGFLHTHPTYALGEPFGDGVYAVEATAWVGSPEGATPAPSEPFWIVFAQNAAQAALDDALAWLVGRAAGGGDDVACPDAGFCPGDFDRSGDVEIGDIFQFLNAWFASDPRADVDGGGVGINDIFVFLNRWFAPCP